MRKKILGILVVTLLIATSFSIVTVADWDPEDGHKMHFPQLPDPNGWDVHATAPIELADDWHCTETGYVEDIHFWGSWFGDRKGVITSFKITIYNDIPADQSPTGYSMPGEALWSREVRDWVERGPYYGDQGWYWCEDDYYLWHDHQQYYQYNVFLDEPWLLQEYCNIYWLGISANVQQGTGTWGWKSSKDHWNDDAAWRAPGTQWVDMWEPEPPTTNQFWLTMIEGDPVEAGGTDYYDDGTSFWGWYYYYYMGEPWWLNIWFYNAPFNYDKYKEIYVSFFCEPISQDPVFFVINWATDIWSLEGVPGRPPLPGDVEGNPQLEDMYIGRWPSPVDPILVEPGFNEFWLDIPGYNPEWVSIDFWGWGSFAIVEGIITHHCLPPEHEESLDLAFVITGEPAEQPCVDIEKKVQRWIDFTYLWFDEIDQNVSRNVTFKIEVHNCGNPDLTNIKVVDTLPACLEYIPGYSRVDGNYQEPTIVGNQLTWTIPGPLTYCNTITILFGARVISTGKNVNEVTVTTDEGASDSDTATVNGIGTAVPKIDCRGSLSWTNIPPGSTQNGTFTVGNIGDPGSLLKWKVCGYPTWGTWSFSPSNGTGVTPVMVTLITVTVVAPNQQNQQYSGQITLCNEEDSTDTCTIQVSLATPKNKVINPFILYLERLMERFPILERILQPIYDKLTVFM